MPFPLTQYSIYTTQVCTQVLFLPLNYSSHSLFLLMQTITKFAELYLFSFLSFSCHQYQGNSIMVNFEICHLVCA